MSSARNVRDFGAVGDGKADDTTAIANACAVGDGLLVLYLPAGAYRVTAWPDLPDYAAVIGDGSDVTTIGYAGDGPLIALRGKHRVSFKRLGIYVTGATGAAVSLSECFRCSFDSVVLRGGHVSTNYPEFTQQRGVILDQNTGGTAFINCDVNNFGIGLTTRCIQNYVTSSKFTSNYVGVLGTGNDHSAGLSMVNVEFVSDTDPNTTDKHVLIDGAANDWWLTNVWFEGADIALSIGNRDRGGPRNSAWSTARSQHARCAWTWCIADSPTLPTSSSIRIPSGRQSKSASIPRGVRTAPLSICSPAQLPTSILNRFRKGGT